MTRTRAATASALLLAALAGGLLTGCTTTPDPPVDGAPAPLQVTPGPPPPAGATGAPVAGVTTLPPVGVGDPAPLRNGLVARVVTVAPAQIEARGPGEIAGPGSAVTVELTNESADPIDLAGLAVNAYSGDGVPAAASSSPPAAAATGQLAPGSTATGVYLFQVTTDSPELTVEINHSGSPDVALVRR